RHTGIFAIALLLLTAIVMGDADAARLGGGKSIGAQRPSVTPRATAPQTTAPSATTPSGAASNPVMPAQPGAAAAAKPMTPAAAAPSGASRWLGPIAGIAAGLGLAALLSHFGLPEGLASFLLIGLLIVAAIVVVRMIMARRTQPQRSAAATAGSADFRSS